MYQGELLASRKRSHDKNQKSKLTIRRGGEKEKKRKKKKRGRQYKGKNVMFVTAATTRPAGAFLPKMNHKT